MKKLKLPEKITDYFRNKRAMVIDESEPNRAALVRALVELGVQHNNISSLKTLDRAAATLKQRRPNIIVTELSFGERETLKLLRDQRELFRSDRDCMTLVVTATATETAVAAAAEDEVDCYVLKPYSIGQFMTYVMKTAIKKLAPNPYLEKIEEGREFLSSGDLDQALNSFQYAVSLNDRPSMAHYQTAATLMQLGSLDRAKTEFERGLSYNELHYKCLSGYADLLVKLGKPKEAYQVLKKSSQHFPLGAERIRQLIELAVEVKEYQDVIDYFKFFIEFEEREPTLVKAMADGLLACGKNAVREENFELASDAFGKGLSVTGRNRRYIFDVATLLIDADQNERAREFLKKCDPAAQESKEFVNYMFLIDSANCSDGQIVDSGRKLIKEGKAILATYIKTINCLKKMKKDRAMEDVIYQAIEEFPDDRSRIMEIAA